VEVQVRVTHRDDSSTSVPGATSGGGQTAPETAVRGRRGLRYLPGLDGIRAIAVIGVLLFHADLTRMQGGFLGVDLFFVLSGFLITSLLLQELDSTGRLKFGAFYLRRARRLLPALFLTLAGTLGLALLFARDAVMQVLKDIPFALTYVTNWAYVFRGQSYFEAIGRPPLLQHLWSLAIEEQFYLVWPSVVFLLAYLFRRHLHRAVLLVAGVGAVVSTVLMAWSAQRHGYPDLTDPSPVYFATHTHAMGILTGAAVAALFVGRFQRGTVSRRTSLLASIATVVGIVGVVASFVLVSQYSSALYRGGMLVFALVCALAVGGAAVPGAWAGNVLGAQPLRYLGQRSYGLYLYHWPVFMLLRPGQDIALSGWANVVLRLGITVVVAELSYRFVEMPVRTGAFSAWWRGDAALAGNGGWFGSRGAWRRIGVVTLGVGLAAVVVSLAAHGPRTAVPVAAPTLPISYPSAGPAVPATPTVHPTHKPVVPAVPVRVVRARTTFVGDSVMLGARGGLRPDFSRMHLDAVVGRQPREFPRIIKGLRLSHRIHEVVIVHMGTNGYVSAPILRHVLAQLTGARRVVLVTVHVPRPWTNGSNIMIRKIGPRYKNVRIADWGTYANGHPGWFVKDGAHLTPAGVKAYAALLARTAVA
jgi:peptidoglycan/LPS O-acetylase OafA/YrhL